VRGDAGVIGDDAGARGNYLTNPGAI
jgi:hypothetical protein